MFDQRAGDRYYAFPEEHWRRTRTNNPLERILRDGGARVSWARSLTVNPRSTSPPQGCATSPARRCVRKLVPVGLCSRLFW
jgi:hypothetical protein